MKLANLKPDADGYMIDGETGERAVFYECDPAKNFLCEKRMCRASAGAEGDGALGLCSCTLEPAFRKDGGRAFYKRWNGEYYGREYIEEVGDNEDHES